MHILKSNERKVFTYKGLSLEAIGTFCQDTDIMGKVKWSQPLENTPADYSWEDFIQQSDAAGILTADVYVLNDELVTPTTEGLCLYIPSLPPPPKTYRKWKQLRSGSIREACGEETFVMHFRQKPLCEVVDYTYTHFSKGIFSVVAPTLDICRIYKNLWLNNKLRL